MGWMGAHQGAGMPINIMPGYASSEQMAELSLLDGRDRGRRWLELMRAHHLGGVIMASEAKNLASLPKITRLANFQVKVQTFEISQYDVLLAGPYV